MIFSASHQTLICRFTYLLFCFQSLFWGELSAGLDLTSSMTEGADSLAGFNPQGVAASHRKNKSPNLRNKTTSALKF
jgi:hypothetical protein